MPTDRKRSFSELARLAGKQHGLMTHEQATSAGLSRAALSRLVRRGVWQRVRPRVFRRAAASQTDEQAVLAVLLWAGEGAVASHRSAAQLLGVDLGKGAIEVTTPPGISRKLPGVIFHRSNAMEEADLRLLRGIPVTAGARTIIDLASTLDEEALAIAVEEAWRKEIAAPDWVARRLKELGLQGRQTGALSEILADCRARKTPLESALEVRFWRLLKRAQLPLPNPAYEFRDDFGQPFHVDFAYPAHHLAIECDGYATHGTREAFENDRLRAARLVALGWRVMPVTWSQLDVLRGADVVKRLRLALRYRGQSIG